MSNYPKNQLTAEQLYNLSKCNALHAALGLDKNVPQFDTAPMPWTDEQRASLAARYLELLLAL